MCAARKVSREYSVSIRLYSEELSPEEVTAMLRIRATDIQRKGDKAALGKTFKSNMWGYQSECDRFAPLEDHLKWLLQKVSPSKELILSISEKVTVVFWCACFISGPETTVAISRETLSEMASLRAEFSLSLYPAEK